MLSQIHKRNKQEFEEHYKDIYSGVDNYSSFCDIRNRMNKQSLSLIDGMVEMVEGVDGVNIENRDGTTTTLINKQDLKSLLLAQREIIEKSQ